MRTQKLSALLFFLVAASVAAAAVDFGIAVTSESVADGELGQSFQFDQRAAAELSFTATPDESVRFHIAGFYEYLLSGEPYYFALNELIYGLSSGFGDRGAFSAQFGRFEEIDLTQRVFLETIDGFELRMSLPTVGIGLVAGYTGLVFQESSTVLVSVADAVELSDGDLFGPPRVYVSAQGTYALGDGGWHAGAEVSAQFDMHDSAALASEGDSPFAGPVGGAVNTQYQTFQVAGPIAPWLAVEMFGTLGTGSTLYIDPVTLTFDRSFILSSMGGLELTAHWPVPVRPRIEASVLYVSGDADAVGTIEGNGGGLARGFVPVSIPDITVTQSVFLTNLLLPELSATVYPFGALSGYAAQNTFLSVSGAALMRPTVGAGPIEGIAATATDLYLGTEATAELEIGIAPFVSINLNGGMFFPYAPALLNDSITYRAVGTVEVRF